VGAAGSNALGLSGLLALARAFSAPEARLRRPVVFVATSGSGNDFAGTRAFVVPARDEAAAVVAATLDLRGGPSRGSLAVDGVRELAFRTPSTSVSVVAALHSELGLTLVDTGSVLETGTNNGVFSNHWITTLGFRTAGSPVPAEQAVEAGARVLR